MGSGGNQPNQPLPPSPYGGQQQQQPPQQQLPQQQYGGPPPGVYGAPPQQPQQQPSPFGGSSAYEQPQHNPYNNAGSSSSSSSNAYQPPAAAAAAAPGPYSAQTNSRPVVRDEAVGAITPIAALNPYGSKWTIKARVTSKSDIRRWSNARGEGTLFSIDLLDADNGEIRATFFKEACDKWFSQIEEQRVYTFSNGKLKVVTNKAFTSIKNNYEVTFDMHSEIRPCMEDSAIKSVNYSFTKLDQIESVEVNHTVDILAVISSASELNTVVQKSSGKELKKRDLVVYDDTGVEVRLTVWGDKAENEGYDPGFVLVVKGAKVGDFQGRSLSLTSNSSLVINPQLPEAEAMYHQCAAAKQAGAPMRSLTTAGGERGMEPLAGRHTLSSLRDDSVLGRNGKADFVTVKATMSFIKNDDPARLWYTACPTPQCNKKMTEGMPGVWHCEKCHAQHANCTRRYIMSATMMDHTGQVGSMWGTSVGQDERGLWPPSNASLSLLFYPPQSWVSFFNETAEKVLGLTADSLFELYQNDQYVKHSLALNAPPRGPPSSLPCPPSTSHLLAGRRLKTHSRRRCSRRSWSSCA